MGNLQSVAAVDGQAATGKTSFIKRMNEKHHQPELGFIYSDVVRKSTYHFVRGDDEDVGEWPVCPLDTCQSGITHSYWMDLLSFVIKSENRDKKRVVIDRSPVSHYIYEFWWKRLFPIIKDAMSKDSQISLYDDEVDAGWVWIRRCMLRSERVRESLNYFTLMIKEVFIDLHKLLVEYKISATIYLSYATFSNQHQHNLTDQRREERGGFDRFPESPLEGDRTEWCQKLYAAGEALLWTKVFDTYQTHRWALSTRLEVIRLTSTADGLIDLDSAEPLLFRTNQGVKRDAAAAFGETK